MSESSKPKKNLLQRIIGWFADLFAWIKETLTDEEARKAMLTDLGLDPGTPAPSIPQGSLDSIDRYRKSKDPNEAAFLEVVRDIQTIIGAVKAFIKAAGVSGDAAIEEYSHRFFELMTLSYLRLHQPALYWAAQPFGFVEESLTTHSTAKTYPERIVSFFKGIGDHFNDYVWRELETEEQAKATSDLFLILFPMAMMTPGVRKIIPTDFLYGWEIVGDSPPPLADHVSDRALSFLLYKSPDGPLDDFISCTLMLVPRAHGGPGLFIAFGGSGGVESELGDGWKFKFNLTSANAIDFLIRLEKAGVDANAVANAGASFSIEAAKDESQQPFVVGISKRSRLEFGRLSFSGELSSSGAGVKLLAEESALVIDAANDGDGLVSETMPKETRIAFNLGIGVSSERGLYLEGGSGLRSIIPIAKSLGPVNVQSLLLGLTPNTDQGASNLALEAGATLDVKLGPVKASIDQIGFRAVLDFAKTNPNLGFADLSLGFKPPYGVGLAIDAAGIEGGGFLLFDPAKGQYAGIIHVNLDLERCSMTVKAVGLINTRLPDGTKGFSLIVIITAEFIWPLGFGFVLTGLGVILGINRTVKEDVLQAGIKNHTLDSILFPKDPIANAPALLGALGVVFPPAKSHHFIGGMAQIVWGKSPLSPLLTINLALALEFGARSRLIVMGQLKSLLPNKENDLVRLQMDAVGIIDFDQKTAALDATLFDSRLAKTFTITGDMAMRMRWGDSPNFALAVGGLHPDFTPPAGFPKLARVSINLSSGDNPRLRCEAYIALTSNTVQFGARAEVFAKASKFSVQGEIGFDVLIQFDPFYFIASFHAMVQLKCGSVNLFKVRLEGKLSGPRPLHVRGKATFEILWWDYSVTFDKTLVEGERPPLAAPINVSEILLKELNNPANWNATLAVGDQRLVTLREDARAGEVIIHPLSQITVRQSVVPLDREIARFGSARPSGARQFKVTKAWVNDQARAFTPVAEYFAPAQFLDMSDDQKLSSPSFEMMTAGAQIGSDDVVFGGVIMVKLEYEEITVDLTTNHSEKSVTSYKLKADVLNSQARWGAAAQSDAQRAGKAKYRAPGLGVKLDESRYAIASVEDLSAPAIPGTGQIRDLSFTEASVTLRKLRRENPLGARILQVVAKETVR